MTQIPLDSFRILEKRFGWEKSFNEIASDDENDIELMREAIRVSKERFIDSETDELGEWEGASQDIAKIWLKFFSFQMRITVKTEYIATGVTKRGIPMKIAQDHIQHVTKMKALLEDLFIVSTYVHIIFLFWHMYTQESDREKNDYFNLLFEKFYLTPVMTAYEIAKEHPMFPNKAIDLRSIESKLRIKSKENFEELWKTANEQN